MSDKIFETQRKINKILQELELEESIVIESISIDRIESTRFNDDRRKFITTVNIETHRLPGNEWSV